MTRKQLERKLNQLTSRKEQQEAALAATKESVKAVKEELTTLKAAEKGSTPSAPAKNGTSTKPKKVVPATVPAGKSDEAE